MRVFGGGLEGQQKSGCDEEGAQVHRNWGEHTLWRRGVNVGTGLRLTRGIRRIRRIRGIVGEGLKVKNLTEQSGTKAEQLKWPKVFGAWVRKC